MHENASNNDLLDAWRRGDQTAAQILFLRFQARLLALVRSRLSRRLARRTDPEDVVLSAYRSFFIAARSGRVGVNARGDLWPLLATMTLRKLAHQARQHHAERRSVAQDVFDASCWLQNTLSRTPTADHAALLEDEVEHLLNGLDDRDQEVAVRILRGEEPSTIAGALNVHERTIRRVVARIADWAANRSAGEPLEFPSGMAVSVAVQSRDAVLPSTGTTLTYDDVVLHQFLGAGAFTKVFRGTIRATGERVAIKFLRRECWSDPQATASLLREYRILRELSHPNILSIRGWGTTHRGVVFLTLEYVAGTNLADWQRRTSPPVSDLVTAVRFVAVAVAAAHTRGILHGDLKPSNVLRHDDGRIILCDFGLARWANDPEDVPRGGTAGFLCPEQICDAFGPVTERSDVYGLGGLLYALLTGQPPMKGADLPETLANVLSSVAPIPPSVLASHVSPELEAIVMRCLAKEPCDRYASATAVESALAALG